MMITKLPRTYFQNMGVTGFKYKAEANADLDMSFVDDMLFEELGRRWSG